MVCVCVCMHVRVATNTRDCGSEQIKQPWVGVSPPAEKEPRCDPVARNVSFSLPGVQSEWQKRDSAPL